MLRKLVLPGDTGFWGAGIGKDEIILYLDKSRVKRRINVPNTYAIDGKVIKVRIVEVRTHRALTQRST